MEKINSKNKSFKTIYDAKMEEVERQKRETEEIRAKTKSENVKLKS